MPGGEARSRSPNPEGLDGALPPGPKLYCTTCDSTTQHLDVLAAASLVGVSRSAVYLWMKQGAVHWAALPRGVRVICRESLSKLSSTRPWLRPLKEPPADERPIH
jgi:predicted DNA-binding transcriptional regulator AlpA